MNKHNEEKQYITLASVCLLLNRDPNQLDELFGESVEVETVDDQLVVNLQVLLDHIEDTATEMIESE